MPDISIIIPAYNEVRFIEQTLSRLLDVVKPLGTSCEIIVVDNGSTDLTAVYAATFKNVIVLRLGKRQTISAARNAGASAAKGTLLVFIDADVFVTPTWANHLYRRLPGLQFADIVTGGQYRISKSPGWIERYWFKAMEERRPNYINGGNLIVGKALFKRLRGFRNDLVTAEDVEFCRRASREGAKIDPDPEFIVHHEGYPKDLRSFFKREIWTGRGDVSSLAAFMVSKTAIIAVLVSLLLVVSVGCVLVGLWRTSLSLALGAIAVSMASVLYKFGFHSPKRFLVNTGVMLIHFVARSLAFIDIEKKA